jgi:hypothetical protein
MSNLAEDIEPPVPQEEIAAATPEVKTEAEVKTDAPEGQAEEKKEEVQPEKLVRLEALHEERGKRKQLQRELEQTKQQQAVLAGRLQQLFESQQPRPQVPDQATDPLGYMVHQQEMTQQELQALRQRQQQEDYYRQQQAAKDGLVQWAAQGAAEFAKEAPDFVSAYEFMQKKRAGELQAMGLPPQQIRKTMENDELWVYTHAYQTGKNPGQVIYDLAKVNGYTGKKGIPAEEKMQTLQKGVAASKTLGAGGGSAGNPTPEQIANMSESEFAELKAKLEKKGQRLSDVL